MPLANDVGIGLTPHGTVVERALATVEAVSATMAKMQATGGMKEINQAFKAARLDNLFGLSARPQGKQC